jgi:hypothetical protein
MAPTTPARPITSEILHNKNCHAYLNKLALSPFVLEKIRAVSPELATMLQAIHGQPYHDTGQYADLYTKFFTVVEDNIAQIFDEPRKALLKNQVPTEKEAKELKELDHFIFSLYDNENSILESTFEAIQHIPLSHGPVKPSIEGAITEHLKDSGRRINIMAQTPAQAGSAYGRFTAMIAKNFKPQHTTSLATVRIYEHTKPYGLREYRFGTQAQRHEGTARVSPLFERWLEVHARKYHREETESPITHLYINNLGWDRTSWEGSKERELTRTLHTLESQHPNVAVITLPADKGFMEQSAFKKTHDRLKYTDSFNQFLLIASQDKKSTQKVKDFHISDNVRRLIFKDEAGNYSLDTEKEQLRTLLTRSFRALGFSNEDGSLSSAQRQAVWFHFIKFELANHIITKLNPQSVNFSCKDAIDRGGVSSLYYNLMKSFEAETPMSRVEFERGLHAAPTLVKARGMNHHLKLIWNAVDVYLDAHYEEVKTNPRKAWLIEWRDLNCPHARVEDLLTKRILQVQDTLRTTPKTATNTRAIEEAETMLIKIQQQYSLGVSGKRLLLEVVTRTPEVILHPGNKENIDRYAEVAAKLTIKYPRLQFIVGMMKSMAGFMLSSFAFGRDWMEKGYATAMAGLDASRREEIQIGMNALKQQIQDIRLEGDEEDDLSP